MSNFTANGNSNWFRVLGSGFQPSFTGDFGGGTITFELKVGNTTFTLSDHDNSDADYEYTDDFHDFFNLQKGTHVRAVLASATDPDIQYEMNGCVEINS